MGIADRILKFFWPSCKLTPGEFIRTLLLSLFAFVGIPVLIGIPIGLAYLPSYRELMEDCNAKGGIFYQMHSGPNLCIDQRAIIQQE